MLNSSCNLFNCTASEKQDSCLGINWLNVPDVYPCDCVAGWELWLTAQYHQRLLYQIPLALKRPKCKIRGQFLLDAYCFCTTVESKTHKRNHCKLGTRCKQHKWKLFSCKLQVVKITFYHLTKNDISTNNFLIGSKDDYYDPKNCHAPMMWIWKCIVFMQFSI